MVESHLPIELDELENEYLPSKMGLTEIKAVIIKVMKKKIKSPENNLVNLTLDK